MALQSSVGQFVTFEPLQVMIFIGKRPEHFNTAPGNYGALVYRFHHQQARIIVLTLAHFSVTAETWMWTQLL